MSPGALPHDPQPQLLPVAGDNPIEVVVADLVGFEGSGPFRPEPVGQPAPVAGEVRPGVGLVEYLRPYRAPQGCRLIDRGKAAG